MPRMGFPRGSSIINTIAVMIKGPNMVKFSQAVVSLLCRLMIHHRMAPLTQKI